MLTFLFSQGWDSAELLHNIQYVALFPRFRNLAVSDAEYNYVRLCYFLTGRGDAHKVTLVCTPEG